MVVAFARRGNQDVIMFDNPDKYVVQSRCDLHPVKEHTVNKVEDKDDDTYREASGMFETLVTKLMEAI